MHPVHRLRPVQSQRRGALETLGRWANEFSPPQALNAWCTECIGQGHVAGFLLSADSEWMAETSHGFLNRSLSRICRIHRSTCIYSELNVSDLAEFVKFRDEVDSSHVNVLQEVIHHRSVMCYLNEIESM